jgi:hypothetical protein
MTYIALTSNNYFTVHQRTFSTFVTRQIFQLLSTILSVGAPAHHLHTIIDNYFPPVYDNSLPSLISAHYNPSHDIEAQVNHINKV